MVGKYPLFRREGDDLLKVSWSKKAGAEYEHRAPWAAVEAFVGGVAAVAEPGKLWTVERVLPAAEAAYGRELPGYRAYLILAWLRAVDLVVKRGRNGYVADPDALTVAEVRRHFEAMN